MTSKSLPFSKALSIFPILLLCVASLIAAAAPTPFADGVHVSPATGKAQTVPFTVDRVKELLGQLEAVQRFTQFKGANEALKQKYLGQNAPLQGGEVVETDLGPRELFGTPVAAGAQWVHMAGVYSADAEAVRLRIDLSGLAPGAQAWMADPGTGRLYGPYVRDAEHPIRWLAAIHGEEAVLLVVSAREDLPDVRMAAYSHIFLAPAEIAKELSCNLDIACETDAGILAASSGTAIILVGGLWFCSGTLVDNPQTEDLEPLFLTANHCVCSGENARDVEAYWDYRCATCDGSDAPDISDCPRSAGVGLLATDAVLDSSLIKLDTVPGGEYGRTYVGWDTRAPVVDEDILSIHYPDTTHMRISKGTVRAIDQDQIGRQKQTMVHWDQGVTESGSSGACLLFADSLRICGTLSQGPSHTCRTDRSGNLDWFSSFRSFYPAVSQYIDSPTPSATDGADDCRQPKMGRCPLQIVYESEPAKLEQFRAIRDKMAGQSRAGQYLVQAYYKIAPVVAPLFEKSPEACALFKAVTGAFLQK